MGSSDSDTENECFESAEESLDENEELGNVEIKSKKSLGSSERKVAEPASNNDLVNTKGKEEKHESNNSLSFRKRPERVKRLPNKTPTRSTSKSPTSELIFKTDKIVPDVFFQDITSNLSKNINKSISTLQQKSSNVKDLIFSSLPSSSCNVSEGFSYDDKSAITPLDECITSNTQPDSQNTYQSDSELLEPVTNENVKNKEETFVETSITETNSTDDSFSEIKKEIKPPDILSDASEDKFQGDCNLLDDAAGKEDICFSKEKPDTLDSLINEDNDLKMENVPEEERDSFKNSSENNSETLINQERSSSEEFNKTDSVNNVSKNKTQENESFTESKQNITENEEGNLSFENTLEASKSLICSEITANSNLIITDVNMNDFNQPTEELSEVKSECNLKELKMVLKNIVEEEKVSSGNDKSSSSSSSNNNNSNNNNNNNNNEALKDELNPEEKLNEVYESSKDGWDDFDFSDNEVENIMSSENNKPLEGKAKNADEVKSQKCGPEITSEKTVKEKETKVKEPISHHENTNKTGTLGKHPTNKNQEKEYAEPEPVPDESWDWDNWDETSEEKEDKVDVSETEKQKSKNVKENESSDVSKWTGWETFGQKSQEKQGNWGLGSWGVDMLLNKATAVTQGISNVLEAGLGAPDPETLARMEKLEREKFKEERVEENGGDNEEYQGEVLKKNSLTNVNLFPVAGLTSLVAGVTSKIVEHSKIQEIGTKVITGGLDTLETFGKKTMEVLQEGDPGLKNKRALLLGSSKPVLSQVLREAREKAERESKKAEEKELAKKCHFETLFDDFQGMIHLEALEMLSTQCELKLDQIRSGMNLEEQEDLNGILEEVGQLCSLDECDMDLKSSVLDFKTVLQMAVEPLKNEISVTKIAQIHEDVTKWLQASVETEPSFTVINQKLVSTLAELTAAIVQQFHKSGELLSIKECRKTVEEVDALSRLTNVLCKEIEKIGEKFIKLSRTKNCKEINGDSPESFAKKANLVMENSTSYIRQAFDLLIPVLQLGAAV